MPFVHPCQPVRIHGAPCSPQALPQRRNYPSLLKHASSFKRGSDFTCMPRPCFNLRHGINDMAWRYRPPVLVKPSTFLPKRFEAEPVARSFDTRWPYFDPATPQCVDADRDLLSDCNEPALARSPSPSRYGEPTSASLAQEKFEAEAKLDTSSPIEPREAFNSPTEVNPHKAPLPVPKVASTQQRNPYSGPTGTHVRKVDSESASRSSPAKMLRRPHKSDTLQENTQATRGNPRVSTTKGAPGTSHGKAKSCDNVTSHALPERRRGRPRKKRPCTPDVQTDTKSASTNEFQSGSRAAHQSHAASPCNADRGKDESVTSAASPSWVPCMSRNSELDVTTDEVAALQNADTRQSSHSHASAVPVNARELQVESSRSVHERRISENASAECDSSQGLAKHENPVPVSASASREEEHRLVTETKFQDGRYGACFSCGSAIAIPGLAQFYCPLCGWIKRPIQVTTISPGHHD